MTEYDEWGVESFVDDIPTDWDEWARQCTGREDCPIHPVGFHEVYKSKGTCEHCFREFTWVLILGRDGEQKWCPADAPLGMYAAGPKVAKDVRDGTRWSRHACETRATITGKTTDMGVI